MSDKRLELKFEMMKTAVVVLITLVVSFLVFLIFSKEPVYSFQLLLAGPL